MLLAKVIRMTVICMKRLTQPSTAIRTPCDSNASEAIFLRSGIFEVLSKESDERRG